MNTGTRGFPNGIVSPDDEARMVVVDHNGDLDVATASEFLVQHDIVGVKHSITASAYDLVGAPETDTPGLLTPSADVSGGATAILRSNAGALALKALTLGDLAASTLIYANGSKSVTSLANSGAASYLRNDGAGALSWVTTATPSTHSVLDSTYHSDVLTGSVARGDILYGNATPKIARLAKGSAGAVLTGDGTDTAWSTYFLAGTAAQTYTFGSAGGTIPTSAGTLTVATTNAISAAGVITHAITSSSNPGAAASLLASDASGRLRLQGLGIQTSGVDGFISGLYGSVGLSYYGSGIYLKPVATKYAGLLSSGGLAKFYWDDNLGRLVGTFPLTVGTSDLTTSSWYLYDDKTVATRPNTLTASQQLNIAAGSGTNLFTISGIMSVAGSANYTSNVGSATFQPSHSGSGTVANLFGVNGFAANSGLGTITNALGLNYFIQNTGGGTITNAYAIRIQPLNNSSGIIGTYYGLFIDAPIGAGTTTTAWGAYINGASAIVGNRNVQQLLVTGFSTQAVATTVAQITRADAAAGVSAMMGLTALGSGANGDGGSVLLNGKSSTTAAQAMGALKWLWNDATHASRKADLVLTAYDTAEREIMRGRGAGSAPAIGFLGATPVARSAAYTPTNVTADRSYDANATTLDEIADVLGTLIADLQATGLIG